MPIMVRPAEDDYFALLVCDAMDDAGATIIAITPNGEATHLGAKAPHQRFQVWARAIDDAHIAKVDELIEHKYDEYDAAIAKARKGKP